MGVGCREVAAHPRLDSWRRMRAWLHAHLALNHQTSESCPHAISPELEPLTESSPVIQCPFVTIEIYPLQRQVKSVRPAGYICSSPGNLHPCKGCGMERLVLLLQNGLFRVAIQAARVARQWPLATVLSIAGCLLTAVHILTGSGGARRRTRDGPPPDQPQGTATQRGATASSPPLRPAQVAAGRPLAGVRTVSLSAPGVLTEETNPAQLEESATLLPGAAEALRRLCERARHVVVVAHTDSEVGEAAVRGALDAVDLLGPGAGQLPPHRLIGCSTSVGKLSIIRQLEADVHIEADEKAASELLRLKARVLLVKGESARQAPESIPTIGSLADAL